MKQQQHSMMQKKKKNLPGCHYINNNYLQTMAQRVQVRLITPTHACVHAHLPNSDVDCERL